MNQNNQKHLERLEEYEKAMQSSNRDIFKLEKQMRQLNEYIEELLKRKNQIQIMIIDIQKQLKNTTLTQSSQEKKDFIENTKKQVEKMQKQLKKLALEKLEFKSKCQSIEEALNFQDEKIEKIKNRVLQMQDKRKKADQEICRLRIQQKDLKEAISEIEFNLKKSKANLQDCLTKKKNVQSKIYFLKQAMKELRVQEIKQQGCEKLRKQLEQMTQSHIILGEHAIFSRDQIESLDFEELQKKLKKSEEAIKNAKEALVGYNGTDFDQAQILLKQGLELRHRASFWDIMLPFLVNFAISISDLEKIKKIIQINQEIRKISEVLEPDICAGIFPVVEHNSLVFKFQCGKGGELRDADKELSGGQKSMIAFMATLAFQKVLNVPFLLLDEIDAPLDVVNSQKVARGLKKIMKDKQVITISHRKFFPAEADRVFLVRQNPARSQKVVMLTNKEKTELVKSKKWWEELNRQQQSEASKDLIFQEDN